LGNLRNQQKKGKSTKLQGTYQIFEKEGQTMSASAGSNQKENQNGSQRNKKGGR